MILGGARYLPTMLRGYALYSLVSMLPALDSAAQQYDLRTYSLEEGLPSATVNAICEDTLGYLWIATNEGATRTDGIHFNTINKQQGLPHNDVTALHCTPDGRVWLGCRNGGVAMIYGDSSRTIYPGDPGLGAVLDLVTSGNDLWIATENAGLWRYAAGSLMRDTLPGLPDGLVNSLVVDPRGALICGGEHGIFTLTNNSWISVGHNAPEDPPILCLYADEQGLLAGTSEGFIEFDRSLQLLPPMERFSGFFPITLPDPRVLSIMRSKVGDLWIGTPAGLAHLTKRGGQPLIRTLGEANGLGHDLVSELHQDRSGAIWCGTAFGGVSRFISDAFTHFTDRDGLRSRIVSAIHRTPDGLLWLATAGGGVSVWDDRTMRTYGRNVGLTDPYVLCMAEDPSGFLLVGTATDGVFRWNGQRFKKIPELAADGLPVNVIERDHKQTIWVGHEGGLELMHPDGRVIGSSITLGVLDILHDVDTTWIASRAGLFHIVDDPFSPQKHPTIPDLPLTSLALDSAGNLWIGTDGHGLLRSNGSRLDSVTTEHNSMGSGALGSNFVVSVLLDAYQNVWVGTRRGMDELQLDMDQSTVLQMKNFGTVNGYLGIEAFHNASMLDADSTLWFGTLRGATHYDPHAVREVQDEPQLHLTGVQLFFEDVDWNRWSDEVTDLGIPQGLELPHSKNHLTFDFAGISLSYPERVRYRYILEGHDPDWSPITDQDRVVYSNLPPGAYIFKVLAQNASGIWTQEPLEFQFTIVAPFWLRSWFQIAAVVFIATIILLYIRIRDRRARRDRQRLETMVIDRTKELAQEQQRSESLLLNILPRSTAEELKNKGTADTRLYANCTVLFSDFTGFTALSSNMDGRDLVADLDHFFKLFDRITDRYGVEKIKTIGDAYMCASGIPEPKPSHALDALLAAMGMMEAMDRSIEERKAKGQHVWTLRIGMHSGPLVAGVVGEKKFAYDIWGNTVNLASRVESNSSPGRITISGATYAQVMDYIDVQPRGPIKVRGKGELHMYFALRLKAAYSADEKGLVPNERLLMIRQEMLMLQEI